MEVLSDKNGKKIAFLWTHISLHFKELGKALSRNSGQGRLVAV